MRTSKQLGFLVMLVALVGCSSSDDTASEAAATQAPVVEETRIPPPAVQAQVKRFVTSQSLWCGEVVRFYEDPFKSSVNRKVFYVFCDDGTNAQGYEITADSAGSYLSITEV